MTDAAAIESFVKSNYPHHVRISAYKYAQNIFIEPALINIIDKSPIVFAETSATNEIVLNHLDSNLLALRTLKGGKNIAGYIQSLISDIKIQLIRQITPSQFTSVVRDILTAQFIHADPRDYNDWNINERPSISIRNKSYWAEQNMGL